METSPRIGKQKARPAVIAQLFTRNLQALMLMAFSISCGQKAHVNSVGYIMQDTQQQLCI
jgi:hypothetical protein